MKFSEIVMAPFMSWSRRWDGSRQPEDRNLLIERTTESVCATEILSVEAFVAGLRDLVAEKEVEFEMRNGLKISLFENDAIQGWIKGNLSDLLRIISNLINNSIDALAGELELVTVEVGAAGDDLFGITVRDSGAGIPKEILSKLGQEVLTFGKKGGNGWAIFDAFNRVKNWGGKMEIISSDRGTTVSIFLPRS